MAKDKKKKEKPVYVDDGRTIADMSGLNHPRLTRSKYGPRATTKEKWDTYWNAVKMMFVPMLCVMTGIAVIYMILWLVFFLM